MQTTVEKRDAKKINFNQFLKVSEKFRNLLSGFEVLIRKNLSVGIHFSKELWSPCVSCATWLTETLIYQLVIMNEWKRWLFTRNKTNMRELHEAETSFHYRVKHAHNLFTSLFRCSSCLCNKLVCRKNHSLRARRTSRSCSPGGLAKSSFLSRLLATNFLLKRRHQI